MASSRIYDIEMVFENKISAVAQILFSNFSDGDNQHHSRGTLNEVK